MRRIAGLIDPPCETCADVTDGVAAALAGQELKPCPVHDPLDAALHDTETKREERERIGSAVAKFNDAADRLAARRRDAADAVEQALLELEAREDPMERAVFRKTTPALNADLTDFPALSGITERTPDAPH